MPEYRDIMLNVKRRNYAPVYLLSGEEEYYIDKITGYLEDTVVAEEDREFDRTILFGADTNAAMIMEAAGIYPLLAEKRLVVVREAQSMHLAKGQLDKLGAYMANPNPATVLVIAYKGDKLSSTSALMKEAKKNKEIVIFESPRVKEYKLPGIVKDYCRDEKIPIDEAAIEVLVANVGSSLSKIVSEIEKLRVAIKSESERITAPLVHEHIGVSKDFNNFELINALARRDYFQAINIIRHFEDNPKANPTPVTSAMIFTFFQRVLLAAFSADKTDRTLMEILKTNQYALREIRVALQNYNASQLVFAIHAIRDFDTKSKGIESFQKEYPLLQDLVCRILTL